MAKDHFAHKSKSWDMNSKRVQNAQAIANDIVQTIPLHKEMTLMDFGAGTGLLSYFVSSHIGKIVAVDNSPSMLEMFDEKSEEFACATEILQVDLSCEKVQRRFDGIISSMTIHHIEDIEALFATLYAMLEDDGFIAIADLDSEDGSFHSDNEGVFHYGFERDMLAQVAKNVGFRDISFDTVSTIQKPHKSFTIFMMRAYR